MMKNFEIKKRNFENFLEKRNAWIQLVILILFTIIVGFNNFNIIGIECPAQLLRSIVHFVS